LRKVLIIYLYTSHTHRKIDSSFCLNQKLPDCVFNLSVNTESNVSGNDYDFTFFNIKITIFEMKMTIILHFYSIQMTIFYIKITTILHINNIKMTIL